MEVIRSIAIMNGREHTIDPHVPASIHTRAYVHSYGHARRIFGYGRHGTVFSSVVPATLVGGGRLPDPLMCARARHADAPNNASMRRAS